VNVSELPMVFKPKKHIEEVQKEVSS